MAATATLAVPARLVRPPSSKLLIRAGLLVGLAVLWEALAWSGLLIREVSPPLEQIASAIVRLMSTRAFYLNLGVSAIEVVASLAIGGVLGMLVGVALGASRFVSKAYEPWVYYLAPTPRIVLFPVMLMWFGLGISSKVALGALSAFFTVALSTAAGWRRVNPVLVRVGQTLNATRWQILRKIYLPAMRVPVLTGVQLGFGNAFISVLLSETKLSNQGLGYMIMQVYQRFDMPALYGLLLIAFVLAAAANQFLGRLARWA